MTAMWLQCQNSLRISVWYAYNDIFILVDQHDLLQDCFLLILAIEPFSDRSIHNIANFIKSHQLRLFPSWIFAYVFKGLSYISYS